MTRVVLETARLTLRPPVEADLDAWAALDADAEATRFIGGLQTPRTIPPRHGNRDAHVGATRMQPVLGD